MPEARRLIAQALAHAAFWAAIGYLSFHPLYDAVDENHALVKLSFSHGGERKVDCRRLSPQEIAALPPNERRPNTCTRERLPVVVEMALDGELVYRATLRASGIARDGPSTAYAKVELPVGRHRLDLRLRDSSRSSGFDYQRSAEVTLAPRQVFAVDFRTQSGGFVFPTIDTGGAS